MKEEKKYLRLEEAAAYIGMPANTLKKKVYEKKIPAYKPAKNLLFSVQDLENFVKKSRVA